MFTNLDQNISLITTAFTAILQMKEEFKTFGCFFWEVISLNTSVLQNIEELCIKLMRMKEDAVD